MNDMLTLSRPVDVTVLDDGVFVRLSGRIDESCLPALRLGLLVPRSADCCDVVVDAGAVSEVSDEALAVLLAAVVWTREHGGRFAVSRTSVAFDETLAVLDVVDALPRLTPLAGTPAQRHTIAL